MRLPRLGRYRTVTAWVAALVAVVGALAAFNVSQAPGFLADTAAAQDIARARSGLDLLAQDLAAGRSSASLRAVVQGIDADLGPIASGAARGADGTIWSDAYPRDADTQRLLAGADRLWRDYRAHLDPLVPKAALGASATTGLELEHSLETLNRRVADRARSRAGVFRDAQLAGLGAALLVLGLLIFYALRNLRAEDAAVADARAETGRILDTVSEGLFLLDASNVIGAQTSRALRQMFRREDIAGLRFDALLGDGVPEKTRQTALEYVALLWGERVNENLIKTLNPISEVEIRLPAEGGGTDLRHFAFEFSRVRLRGRTAQVLCTVADVTDRVQLARDLAQAEARQHSQLDLLMSILHVDAEQLAGFLNDSEAAMSMVNSVLKLPARDERAFREKLDRIFREIHALKSEAAALGLASVQERAHRFEDALAELRGRATLTGNDFLPLAVKLDDLFGHLASVRDLVGRLGTLRSALAGSPDAAPEPLAGPAGGDGELPGGTVRLPVADALRAPAIEAERRSLASSLKRLADKVASDHGRQVSLVCVGLEELPAVYEKPLRDVLNQFVRNAVVHGIEPPEERRSADKAPLGTLALEFADLGEQGYELTFQDDGRGLDHERIRATAVARGLISAEAAAMTEPRKLVGYIFRPGFSTAAAVSSDAGRGVGMDLVRDIVARLGGRISLSTRPGQFTRFRVFLPAVRAAVA